MILNPATYYRVGLSLPNMLLRITFIGTDPCYMKRL